MPEIIPLVLSLTAGGGGPSQADIQKQTAAQQAALKSQQDLATKESVIQQAPSIQAQLGGSVAPDYYISESAREAGAAGEENVARQALAGFLGLSSGGEGVAGPGAAPGASPTPPTLAQAPQAGSNIFEELLSRYGGGESSSGDTGTAGGYV